MESLPLRLNTSGLGRLRFQDQVVRSFKHLINHVDSPAELVGPFLITECLIFDQFANLDG